MVNSIFFSVLFSLLITFHVLTDPAYALGYVTTSLKTDYRINPIGLEVRHLHFFWRLTNGSQTAWQVQVATSPQRLDDGQVDLWDSGKQSGCETTHIAYRGKPPASRQQAWWRVRAWDAAGRSTEWSEPAMFEMGLLSKADWHDACWIGCDRELNAPEQAPAEVMGPWIAGPSEQNCRQYALDVELPDKPVVSAMAWWGLSRPAAAAVLPDYEDSKPARRDVLVWQLRPVRPGGFVDLAFYLKPGMKNRIGLVFKQKVRGVMATVGMRIVFADGEERIIRSGPDWRAIGVDHENAPVRVVESYGGPQFGKARLFPQRSLPPAWFRKAIDVKPGLRRARLYLSALGYGRAYINGKPVNDSLFSPPQSDYEAFAFYTTQDITKNLQPGTNVLAVLLAPGWYHQVGGFYTIFSYGRPGLKGLVALDYTDGRTTWVTTGEDWEWKEGALRSANTYRGERVDYRLGHKQWHKAWEGTGWKRAQLLSARTPKLLAMDVVPVRATRGIKPVKLCKLGDRTWLYDVGEIIHGWARLKINEPAGATVRIRYTEASDANGLWNVPESHWRCHSVSQGDTIISDGRPHVFEPQFTAKSFRYFEVSGLTGEPAPGDVTAVMVQTDVRQLVAFESSDPLLNRLFDNAIRTYRNYLTHILGDIPREQCLWGADSSYSWAMGFYGFDWAPNYRLMHRLWCTGAMAPQGIPGCIGVGKRLTTLVTDFSWSITPLHLASKLYQQYGDLGPAAEFYDFMRHFLRYYEKHSKGGTFPADHKHNDHAFPEDIPRNPAKGELIAALDFFDGERYFARMADALGRRDDAAHARAHAEKIRAAIIRKFYDPAKHTFGNGTHDSLALAFRLIEDSNECEALAASLAGYYRDNGHQFDGGFMSYEIYPMLARYGYGEDALKMLRNPDYPGPAWSIKNFDATTYWERYLLDVNKQKLRGWDFIAFAHPAAWLLTDVAGIRLDSAVAGGRHLIFSPTVPRQEKLDWVRASLETLHGTAHSEWTVEEGRLIWQVTVPPNTTAEIAVPALYRESIDGAQGLEVLASRPGRTVYEAGPGQYRFTSKLW